MMSFLSKPYKLAAQIFVVGFIFSIGISTTCFADYDLQNTEPVVAELSSEIIPDNDIVKCAMRYVGSPYSWGGEDPYTGFDCSGFVYYVYQQFGVELNRTAEGLALCGESISPSEVQTGDVMCFYSDDGSIYHCGIYIGNGLFIHSDSESGGVIISPVSGYYASRGYEVRRILLS